MRIRYADILYLFVATITLTKKIVLIDLFHQYHVIDDLFGQVNFLR